MLQFMEGQLELHHTYTPHEWDSAIEIDSGLVHVLNYFKENRYRFFHNAIENMNPKKCPQECALEGAELIKYVQPLNGMVLTDSGHYVLEQILQNHKTDNELCGNMLIVNTNPYPEESDKAPVSVVTQRGYHEAVKSA